MNIWYAAQEEQLYYFYKATITDGYIIQYGQIHIQVNCNFVDELIGFNYSIVPWE